MMEQQNEDENETKREMTKAEQMQTMDKVCVKRVFNQ